MTKLYSGVHGILESLSALETMRGRTETSRGSTSAHMKKGECTPRQSSRACRLPSGYHAFLKCARMSADS